MAKVIENFDIRELVSKDVFDKFGEKAWQFISDNIIKLLVFIHKFFNDYFKKDPNVESVSVLINNWHLGGPFQWRGLRTVNYILDQIKKGVKTAMLSQHIGGSTNAIDFNIIVKYKDGRKEVIHSDKIFDIIKEHEKEFMQAGLTTLENKTMTQGWTHADCRYTGLDTLHIVNP